VKSALASALILCSSGAASDPLDRWAAEIAQASARFSIPEPWVRRVMRAESGGETMIEGQPIVSRAGAMGLMQLMPGTWRDMRAWLGLGADPNDPRDNILAGTFYLRLMYDRFGYPGLFAAYNAGAARYAAFLAGTRQLPAETRAYVAAVTGQQRPRSATAAPSRPAIFVLQASAGKAAALTASSSRLFVLLAGPPRQ
jgi:soluble lytic murein transglycosylase-like protein